MVREQSYKKPPEEQGFGKKIILDFLDFVWGSSISDDRHLALYVKDYLEDPDGYAEKAFDCFVMSCRAKGDYLFWDEFL